MLFRNNWIGSNVCFGSLNTQQKRRQHLSNVGKENIEKNIWPTNRKWRMKDPRQSRMVVLHREPDVISEIRKGRLRWLGHVERMPEERIVKKCSRISQKENGPLESQERDD